MSTESLLDKFAIGYPDEICCRTSSSGNLDDVQDYLVLFLPGNPGLISYYEPFFGQLKTLLESSTCGNARFHICGHSYIGFEVSPYSKGPIEPQGLQKQIEHQEKLLKYHVENQHRASGQTPKVILIGHSVGSYILLEMIQRHRNMVSKAEMEDFDLIGGILLFPTIVDIAKSRMGRVAKLVLRLPGFARIVGGIARGMAYVLPTAALKGVVRFVTRFPDYAVKTTASWLSSPMGVRQALYLAKDEMEMIGEKEWAEEVGLAKRAIGTNDRDTINWNLTLFWGKGDSWVHDRTRDHIIRRNSTAGQAIDRSWKMELDDEGLPHDFCTTVKNSNNVAGKVKGWIDRIIVQHNRAIS